MLFMCKCRKSEHLSDKLEVIAIKLAVLEEQQKEINKKLTILDAVKKVTSKSKKRNYMSDESQDYIRELYKAGNNVRTIYNQLIQKGKPIKYPTIYRFVMRDPGCQSK